MALCRQTAGAHGDFQRRQCVPNCEGDLNIRRTASEASWAAKIVANQNLSGGQVDRLSREFLVVSRKSLTDRNRQQGQSRKKNSFSSPKDRSQEAAISLGPSRLLIDLDGTSHRSGDQGVPGHLAFHFSLPMLPQIFGRQSWQSFWQMSLTGFYFGTWENF